MNMGKRPFLEKPLLFVYIFHIMNPSIPEHPIPQLLSRQIVELWGKNRLRCGWFIRDGFLPKTFSDFSLCLEILAKHGDRETYIMARKLMKCL